MTTKPVYTIRKPPPGVVTIPAGRHTYYGRHDSPLVFLYVGPHGHDPQQPPIVSYEVVCVQYVALRKASGQLTGRDVGKLHDFLLGRPQELREAVSVAWDGGGQAGVTRLLDKVTQGIRNRLWRNSRKRRGQ